MLRGPKEEEEGFRGLVGGVEGGKNGWLSGVVVVVVVGIGVLYKHSHSNLHP